MSLKNVSWLKLHRASNQAKDITRIEKQILSRSLSSAFNKKALDFIQRKEHYSVDQLLEKAFEIISKSDAKTQKDCALVFSGNDRFLAEQTAIENPTYELIHTTPMGWLLEELKLFDNRKVTTQDAYTIWFTAGLKYIQQASGNITLICEATQTDISVLFSTLPPENTFRSIELAAILANDKIPTINKIDKWLFEPLVTDNFDLYKEAKTAHIKKVSKNRQTAWRKKLTQKF